MGARHGESLRSEARQSCCSAETARVFRALLRQSRAGTGYGRGGRRSFGDLDLLRCRRGLRIFLPLDGPPVFSADGGGATDVCAAWNGNWARARGRDSLAVFMVGEGGWGR